MAVGVNLNPDVSYIDCRIEYDVTDDRANNKSTVTAYFAVRSTGSDPSLGIANFRVTIRNSSGTTLATATRTVQTTIPDDSVWRYYARADYTFTHSSTTGTSSFQVGGGTNSGSDPLNGSAWNSLPNTASSTITATNFQLYPVVPSFSLQRTAVNLTANTSTVSFITAPSGNITTNAGTVTSTSGAVLTTQVARSLTSTPGTYSTFSGSASASPLERVWIKVTSTADGVTVNRSGASTADIVQTIYGLPARPASITLNKTGRQVAVTYGNSPSNGGYDTSPTYTIERSFNNGSSWEAHNNTDLLTPAATYIFRVSATNATGTSEYRISESLFISAYGYRFSGSYPLTAVNMAKIYVGIGGAGADATGWRTVQNVKKYVSDAGSGSPGWIDLTT
jgi:hypothetical protein